MSGTNQGPEVTITVTALELQAIHTALLKAPLPLEMTYAAAMKVQQHLMQLTQRLQRGNGLTPPEAELPGAC